MVDVSDAPPQRLLIVRPSALGDVARTVPALASLRAAFGQARIDWLVRDHFADAIGHHPDLDAVVEFPRSRFHRFGRSWSVTREALAWMADLRQRRYDRVYDLQGLFRSGLFTFASRAPRRVGLADARELATLGYNVRHTVEPGHTVDRMLGLLEADGIAAVRDMRLYVSDADRDWAERFLSDHGIDGGPIAVVAPTANWLCKQWPIERFAALADRLKAFDLDRAIVVGSAGEREQAAPIFDACRRARCIDAIGRTRVGQLMALIERCAIALCNDSAALHLAVGMGRRCLGIYGPTDPATVGPYRYEQAIVAADVDRPVRYRGQKDDQTLISRVSVEQAWAGVERVMAAPPPTCVHA